MAVLKCAINKVGWLGNSQGAGLLSVQNKYDLNDYMDIHPNMKLGMPVCFYSYFIFT